MKNLIRAALALILALSLIACSCPAYAMVKTLDQKVIVDAREYPIMFVAGMAGSVLKKQGTDQDIWVGTYRFTHDGEWEDYKHLSLLPDGKTALYNTNLVATETLKDGGAPGKSVPVYQPFYDYMKKEGFQYVDKFTGNVVPGKNFFDFYYDFRQDNHNWIGDLEKKVDLALKATRSEKIILVAHSMGGLLTRLYMADAARASKVAAVVFMGVPHHGAVLPFWAITNGYNFGNSRVTEATMWRAMTNWTGGYQLLPDFDFLIDETGQKHGLAWINNDEWISEQEYQRYLDAKKEGTTLNLHFGVPNPKMTADSLTFHKELGDKVKDYTGVKYYMIEGTGQPTVESLKVKFEQVAGLPKPILRLEKVMGAGDGTVPVAGAKIVGATVSTVNSEHMSIPSNPEAQNKLNAIRAEVNNEAVRKDLSTKMFDMAKNNMYRVTTTSPTETDFSNLSPAQVMIILFISGRPEPEKIKLKNEISSIAGLLLKDARANITILKGTDKNSPDKPDDFYMLVDNYVVKETGPGSFASPSVKATIDTYDTAVLALKNTSELAKAYTSGKIKIKGEGTAGLAERLNIKILEWIGKYVKFGS